ncbi:GTPase-activating protein RGD2, partial [Ascoidea rubescens DSM 1968]
SFQNSFWSNQDDYESGLVLLYSQLRKGCLENEKILALFTDRKNLELSYGNSLHQICSDNNLVLNPSDNIDLNPSVKNSFKGINDSMIKEGSSRIKISQDIDLLVLSPFRKWSIEHKERINFSENFVLENITKYKTVLKDTLHSKNKYFIKYKFAEDFKQKLDKKSLDEGTLINDVSVEEKPSIKEPVVYYLGGAEYDEPQMKEIIKQLLNQVQVTSIKRFLVTYDKVSTGSNIVQAIQKTLQIQNLEKAELAGQDLIEEGFLRSIIFASNDFANSSKLYYQWKNEAYKLADIPFNSEQNSNEVEKEKKSLPSATLIHRTSTTIGPSAIASYFDGVKDKFVVTETNKENYNKILKDLKRLDNEYAASIQYLDESRLKLEELIMDHLEFMQRCESDRLKAIQKISYDFLDIFSRKSSIFIDCLKEAKMFQESIDPRKDLSFLIENYRTGFFIPKVKVYEDYFSSKILSNFGVNLQTKCRDDDKNAPLIVTNILNYINSIYLDMETDDNRIAAWLTTSKLQLVHQLRNEFNDPQKKITREYSISVLKNYIKTPQVITGLLKLYLLELPDSIIPSKLYDVFKRIYIDYEADDDQRINAITNALSSLPKPNIITLNAIVSHFEQFIDTISKSEALNELVNGKLTKSEYVKSEICHDYANCILRSPVQNNSIFSDKHPFKLLNDLIVFKKPIFKELKK